MERRREAGTAPALDSVAVLGLGSMGSQIVKNLKSATRLRLYDPVEDRRRLVAEELGAECFESAEDAARTAGVVVLVVVDAAQAETALYGPNGAISCLAPGGVVVVMSTIGPSAMRALATRVERTGHGTVDAPMTGGSVLAERGELLVFAAASREDFDRVLPLLQACSREVRYVGPEPGSGQTVKLVNQILCAVHMMAGRRPLLSRVRSGSTSTPCSTWSVREPAPRLFSKTTESG